MVYLQETGHVVARTYYLSGSQAVWRHLPRYLYLKETEKIAWFDKGFGEYSITAPSVLQRGLSALPTHSFQVEVSDPELVFAGTARQVDFNVGNPTDTYHVEVQHKGIPLKGNFYNTKSNPEDAVFFDLEEAPDFTQALTSWQQDSPVYGHVYVELYPSKNGKYRYMMCRDSNGRVWVGGIEHPSEVHSTGLYSLWVNAGVLSTPAFEYWHQAGDNGNPDIVGGLKNEYVDVFTKYLSKIPMIIEYCEVLNRRGLLGGVRKK